MFECIYNCIVFVCIFCGKASDKTMIQKLLVAFKTHRILNMFSSEMASKKEILSL
jgi:hypothetical protein